MSDHSDGPRENPDHPAHELNRAVNMAIGALTQVVADQRLAAQTRSDLSGLRQTMLDIGGAWDDWLNSDPDTAGYRLMPVGEEATKPTLAATRMVGTLSARDLGATISVDGGAPAVLVAVNHTRPYTQVVTASGGAARPANYPSFLPCEVTS